MQLNNLPYRITALTLAFMMFVTSSGLSLDMHFCNQQLKSLSLFGEAKACHDVKDSDGKMKNCPFHQMDGASKSNGLTKKDCCNNKSMQFGSVDDIANQKHEVVVNTDLLHDFLVAFVHVYLTDSKIQFETPEYTQYKPPLITRDIPVLVESFLI